MFDTIIWASDGSETADRALPYAKALADGPGRKLVAVHCKEVYVGRGGGWPVLADEDELLEKIRGQVEEAREEGLDVGLQITTTAALGAAHKIADFARDTEADAIVVGTRGHSPVAGLLLGSLTQRLLHIAPCPVIAVPPDAAAETEKAEDVATAVTH